MKLLRLYKKAGILVFLTLEIIVFSILSPHFFSLSNFTNLLRQVAMLGIASVGICFVMLGGSSNDLSVAGQIPLISMVTAVLMTIYGVPIWLCIILALLMGLVLGLLNGLTCRLLRINPFVVTLGTMTIMQGASLLFSGGISISGLPRGFSMLGQGYFLMVPVPIVLLLLCILVAQFVLSKTYFGRYVYAMGGNPEAARLAGINIDRIRIATFMIAGFFAALSALVMTSRTMIASVSGGSSYAFDCMTACVLGGISFAGGEGKLWGAATGVLVIGILTNAMTLLNVGSYWQDIIKGGILILALYIDRKQSTIKLDTVQ
jgi:ribose/xylose/arabinose/galactoside ABC-type transport system permease subunit